MSFLTSFLNNDSSLPRNDELEVSIFGAGYGECIVVHCGDGEWAIIDSFLYNQSGKPIAMEYLSALQVQKEAVKEICLTHWHDDHCKGSSELAQHYEHASIVLSQALSQKEFYKIVELQKTHSPSLDRIGTGVDNIGGILELAKERLTSGDKVNRIKWATPNRLIYRNSSNTSITSLSPSDHDITKSINWFASLIPAVRDPKLRTSSVRPNDSSVVLWIDFSGNHVLLGADLEEIADQSRGWNAIINLAPPLLNKASIFKIPHHGAESAHSAAVWSTLLEADAQVALTPFTKGKTPLPTNYDIDRILKEGKTAFSAARRSMSSRSVRRDRAVEKTLKSLGIKPRPLDGKYGLVRYRVNGTATDISTFGAAVALAELKAG